MRKIMITLPRQDSIQMEKTEYKCHLKAKERGNSHLHIPLKNT